MSPNTKKRLIVLAAAVALLAATAPVALACMCLEPPPPQEAMEKAGAVFSGRCVKVERVEQETPYGKLPKLRAVLEVKAAWKGLQGKPSADGEAMRPHTVEVWTGSGGGDCGFGFQEGKSYLVYAYVGEDGAMSTDICTRSQETGLARGDLEALGAPVWAGGGE